jgi:hypothetical protein
MTDNISVTPTFRITTSKGNDLFISSVHGEIKVVYEYIEDGKEKVTVYRIIETNQHKLRMEK